jgi:hypothetical protein
MTYERNWPRPGSDVEGLSEISQVIGPIGVLVVVVTWAIMARRNGTGSKHDHQQTETLMVMIGSLRDDMRELRHDINRHLQYHSEAD